MRNRLILVLLALLPGLASLVFARNAQTGGPAGPPSRQNPATQAPTEAQASTSNSRIAAYEGVMVDDVRFRGALRSGQSDLLTQIPQQSHQHLRRVKLRESLQMLYATGRFKTIQVEAEPQPDKGIILVFVVEENLFINALRVYGAPRPPAANQLVNATKLQLGEELTDEKLQMAVDRVKRVMAENGYLRADVQVQKAVNPENQGIEINFIVRRGLHARVGEVAVEGDPGYSPGEIRGIAKLHPGKNVTAAHLNRALSRLRKKYQTRDRLEAQVSLIDRNYHPRTNTLDYTFKVERGPKVEIKVEGAHLRKGVLKKNIPIYEENAVDDDLLNEGKRNLRDYFQLAGFFDVKIDFQQTHPANDLTVVTYEIDKGKRHKLPEVEIRGNHYFPAEAIRERMGVQEANILLRHGRFSQTQLAEDVKQIETLYHANGFEKVNVLPQVIDDYQGHIGRLYVAIDIQEGPQSLVNSMRLEGNYAFDDDRLRSLMSTLKGQPYSDFNVGNDRQALVNFYYDQGFPKVTIQASTQFAPGETSRRDVVFKIDEGKQVFVDKVVVSGLQSTKPFVVSREFQIHNGDPLSQTAMVDTQRKLYDLSIFNQVDMAVQDPNGDATRKDLLFQVEEAKRYTFNYGVGFEVQTGGVKSSCAIPPNIPISQIPLSCNPQGTTGFSPRLSFDATRINFRGRDHTLTFRSRLGSLESLALLSYQQPHWLNRDDLTLTFTTSYTKSQQVLTFTARTLEGTVQAAQDWSPSIKLIYRFTYRRVETEGLVGTVSIDVLQLALRPVRVGLPSFTYIRDHRDNPLDSHKGTYNTLDFGVAAGAFGSEANFSRLLFQNSSYYSFGLNRRWTFARSTRLGVEEPFGARSNTVQGSVPLPERFFLGGNNTHRGFPLNQAGPRDLETGFPIGGEGMFLNNFELRTPPLPFPFTADNLSGVLFHDAGNVFTSAGDIVPSLFRFTQRTAQCNVGSTGKCDFNYLSHAVGGGVRYRTPIGPVRLDVGYNLNPTVFPINEPVFVGKSKGNAIIEPPHVDHVRPRVNFYFSIGQTF